MKAVVVETHEKHVAVLSDDGCIRKLRNQNYMIGQVIEVKKNNRFYKKFIYAASIIAIVSICSITAWAYATPYYYVSLDVNPSIKYSVNRFDRVLSSKAVNDDGESILENLKLKNKNISEAMKDTINEISSKGYFPDDEQGGIVITTSCNDDKKAEKLAKELKENAEIAAQDEEVDVEIEALSVGKKRVEEAEKLGVTPGKLNLVEKLQASAKDTDSIKIEEWLDKPVKDIMKAIKKNKKEEKEATKKENQGKDESVKEENGSETSNQKEEKKSEAPKQNTNKKEEENPETPKENINSNNNNNKQNGDKNNTNNPKEEKEETSTSATNVEKDVENKTKDKDKPSKPESNPSKDNKSNSKNNK